MEERGHLFWYCRLSQLQLLLIRRRKCSSRSALSSAPLHHPHHPPTLTGPPSAFPTGNHFKSLSTASSRSSPSLFVPFLTTSSSTPPSPPSPPPGPPPQGAEREVGLRHGPVQRKCSNWSRAVCDNSGGRDAPRITSQAADSFLAFSPSPPRQSGGSDSFAAE